MTIRVPTTLLTIALAAVAAPASAQWPSFPTPNVPRNADGTVNRNAPAPKTADGKPDLSGLWEIYLSSIAPPPAPGQASPSRSLQDGDGGDQLGIQAGGPPPDPKAPPRATFFDIGANIPGGAPYQDWARELRAQRMADNQKEFAGVMQSLREAGDSLEPFRKDLVDQITYMGSDLNPSAMDSLKPNAEKLNARGTDVFGRADKAIEAASAYFQRMKASQT